MRKATLQTKIRKYLEREGQTYTQKQLSKLCKVSKQTLHTAISRMINQDDIEVINLGRIKNYRLLNKGKDKNFSVSLSTPPYAPPSPHSKADSPKKKKLISTKIVPDFRWHNHHFVIEPYSVSKKFQRILSERGNFAIRLNGWVFKLHTKLIEMQLQSGRDFRSPSLDKVLRLGEEDFMRVLSKASSQWGFNVWKNGKCNIRLVNQHMAVTPSDVAGALEGQRIMVRGRDGRVWFEIDESLNMDEHEFTHPKDASIDARKIEPYLNDWRDNKPFKNSELQTLFFQGYKNTEERTEKLLEGQEKMASLLTSLTNIMETMVGEGLGLNLNRPTRKYEKET